MRGMRPFALFLPLLLLAVSVLPAQAAEDPPRISAEELKSLLGSPGLVVLDVRLAQDWKKSDRQIPGSIRENPHHVKKWMDKYLKDKKIVLYCSWPNEATSASVALKLIKAGYSDVYALKGGWREWEKRGFPMEPINKE